MSRLASVLAILIFSACWSGPAFADDAAILARLTALEQEIKMLKEQLAGRTEAGKLPPDTAVVTASAKDGFSIRTPDDSFKLKVRGQLQADGRFFTDNRKDLGTTDTFTMRRLRAIFEGTLFDQFDFNFTPSFDGGTASVQDAYVDYRHAPELKLRAGKFKVPFELERLQSTATLNFVELGFPAALSPGYDVGVQLHGEAGGGVWAYAAGIFNGTVDGSSSDTDLNSDKEIAGRVFVTPLKHGDAVLFRGLSGGFAATYGHKENAALPTLRSIGQATVFSYLSAASADGDHVRFSPQFTYYHGPLGVLGEYVSSDQTAIRTSGGSIVRLQSENEAWQILVSYVLTGENASFKGVVPRNNFNPKEGTWGAFELVGRHNRLDVDDLLFLNGFSNPASSVTGAEAWGLGMNWYLNKSIKLVLDYEHTAFEGGAWDGAAVTDRPDENAIFTRLQVTY